MNPKITIISITILLLILPIISAVSVNTTPIINNNINISDPIEINNIYIIDDWDNMRSFVANDTTNQHKYTKNYNCMDFSIDMATNLTDAGWDAGIVLVNAQFKRGHMLVWVIVDPPYNKFYIEPILDEIYNPNIYTNKTKNEYTYREISIESAKRNRQAQRSWE